MIDSIYPVQMLIRQLLRSSQRRGVLFVDFAPADSVAVEVNAVSIHAHSYIFYFNRHRFI